MSERQDLGFDRGSDRSLEHRQRVVSCDRALGLMVAQLRVEGEFAMAVDRGHERAAVGIKCDIHPGRGVGDNAIEFWRAQIDREHTPTEKIAYGAMFAGVAQAQLLPHGAAWTISTNQTAGTDAMLQSVAYTLDFGLDAVCGLVESDKSPAIVERNSGQSLGMPPENLLNEFL
jgi:hypothetical protein